MPSRHIVYAIRNRASGAVYVGATFHLTKRRVNHVWSLRRGVHLNPTLQQAWNADGEDQFEFLVLEHTNLYELSMMERYWTLELRDLGVPLYNSHLPTYKPSISEERAITIRKLASALGIPPPALARELRREQEREG